MITVQLLRSNLMVCRNKLRNSFQDSLSSKFTWRSHFSESKLRLRLILLCIQFTCLHIFQCGSRNGPVVDRYVFVFTFLLIKLPMFTKVLSTGRISADMKCFPQAPFFHKLGIFPIKSMLRTVSKCVCIILINSYLHVRHHLPFKVSDLLASLNVTLV